MFYPFQLFKYQNYSFWNQMTTLVLWSLYKKRTNGICFILFTRVSFCKLMHSHLLQIVFLFGRQGNIRRTGRLFRAPYSLVCDYIRAPRPDTRPSCCYRNICSRVFGGPGERIHRRKSFCTDDWVLEYRATCNQTPWISHMYQKYRC